MGLDNLWSLGGSNQQPRREGIGVFHRSEKPTSWHAPLLLIAAMLVSSVTMATVSLLGGWS